MVWFGLVWFGLVWRMLTIEIGSSVFMEKVEKNRILLCFLLSFILLVAVKEGQKTGKRSSLLGFILAVSIKTVTLGLEEERRELGDWGLGMGLLVVENRTILTRIPVNLFRIEIMRVLQGRFWLWNELILLGLTKGGWVDRKRWKRRRRWRRRSRRMLTLFSDEEAWVKVKEEKTEKVEKEVQEEEAEEEVLYL
ncbi:hypothetical protein M0802_011368 [Mischocyttarus mexicanus]|nr:hypothetical protein M0802_011368 [Mischocyttarus mexicanus]